MNTFANWEEVPLFESEGAEADFWAENRPDLRLMETAVAASSESSDSVTITLRIDPRMLARIKRLARSRYLNYQSMIKQWLSERMESEQREREPKQMNNSPSQRHGQSNIRETAAFTLVELLVVIAIIGLLASLVISGAGIGMVKARISRVQTERDALITAIEQYKKEKGYYPPDNTNNTAVNSLYYELTGAIATNNVNGSGSPGFVGVNLEGLNTNQVFTLFNVGGIFNSSSDPGQPPVNFFKATGKSLRSGSFYITGTGGPTFTLFGVPVPPGPPSGFTLAGGQTITPWHYVVSNPTNNTSEFDLWMDVTWSGKTNRISNWNKDPQPAN